MNRVILIGNLTDDPNLTYTPSGTAVANFTLAITRQRYNGEGKKETDFPRIIAWQKLADLAATYLRKGRQCAVEGRLQTRSYDDKEGRKIYVTEVVAENIQFLGSKDGKQSDGGSESPSKSNNNDDPFGDPFADTGKPINITDDDMPF